MKAIITDNLPGNVHQAAGFINEVGVADYLLSLQYDGGNYSTAVFRVERHQAKSFLEKLGKWGCTTERYKAMYNAWADGHENAKPKDFPEPPEQFKIGSMKDIKV